MLFSEVDMATLHIMVGIPGSGKSTYSTKLADRIGATRVSYDEIMESCRGDGHFFGLSTSQHAKDRVAELILGSLERGDVVYDSTNIHERDWKKYMKICPNGTKFHIYWFDIDPDEAMRRQQFRKRRVPQPVLNIMWMAMCSSRKKLGNLFRQEDITFVTENDWVE